MEINDYDDIFGVVVKADIAEGRMGLLTTAADTYDFGSFTDIPGFKVPSTLDEAKKSRFIVTWPPDNRPFPLYYGFPTMSFSLRGGFDQPANLPSTMTLRGSNPANQESIVIPSGYRALAFHEGIFTVPSGAYIYNAGLLAPGANVSVSYSGADAGKLQYEANYDASIVVGRVQQFNTTTNRMTVILVD